MPRIRRCLSRRISRLIDCAYFAAYLAVRPYDDAAWEADRERFARTGQP